MASGTKLLAAIAAVWLVVCTTSRPAAADTVRLVPQYGAVLQDGRYDAVFNGPLASGKAFDLAVPMPGTFEVLGLLEVWVSPDLDKPCGDPPGHARPSQQYQRLAMTPDGTGDGRILIAHVAPLQIAMPYCFHVEITQDQSQAVDLAKFAAKLADQLALVTDKTILDQVVYAAVNEAFSTTQAQRLTPGTHDQVVQTLVPSLVATQAWSDLRAAQVAFTAEVARKPPSAAAIKAAAANRDAAQKAVKQAISAIAQSLDLQAQIAAAHKFTLAGNATAAPADSNASPVSPQAGVMVAVPFVSDAGPWVLPYAAVDIYLAPVDRVIELDKLAGYGFWHSTVLQRVSLSIGLLLTRPTVNDKAIAGLWTDQVPFASLGWRITQFSRIDVGGFGFHYNNANPEITRPRTGWSAFVGASIDFDLWAAAAGKVFK